MKNQLDQESGKNLIIGTTSLVRFLTASVRLYLKDSWILGSHLRLNHS